MKLLLSIVVANYNYGRFLTEAIKSVLVQCEDPVWVDGHPVLPIKGRPQDAVELIICDAASKDNSVEVIRRYEKHLSWWCSEPDGGQSAAFNKGFSHARGEWLTWLNADDFYLPDVFIAFAKLVAVNSCAQWITGNTIHFDSETGCVVGVNWGPHRQPPILAKQHAFSAVFGPTTFWKRELYGRMGPIDEKLHYAMDTEYWARLTMAGVQQIRLNKFCWAFRDHIDSKTEGAQSLVVQERRIRETHYWKGKTGYRFRKSLRNPWYIAWLCWRMVDGSLLIRFYKRKTLLGKDIHSLVAT